MLPAFWDHVKVIKDSQAEGALNPKMHSEMGATLCTKMAVEIVPKEGVVSSDLQTFLQEVVAIASPQAVLEESADVSEDTMMTTPPVAAQKVLWGDIPMEEGSSGGE